jgi:parvulin-like peptidyl-prolyl isomerase
MNKIKYVLIFSCFVVFLLGSCIKKEKPIAKIGWFHWIYPSEINLQNSYTSNDSLRAFESFSHKELLYRAAQKNHFKHNPEIVQELPKIKKEWINSLFYEEVIKNNYGFTEDKIHRYFEHHHSKFEKLHDSGSSLKNNPEELYQKVRRGIIDSLILGKTDFSDLYESEKNGFSVPASAKLAHIFTTDKEKLVLAENALKQGQPFEAVVNKFSEDTLSKVLRGELGVFSPNDPLPGGIGILPELEKILSSDSLVPNLQKGWISPIIASRKGYHLFKVLEYTPKRSRAFKEVKPELNKLALEKWTRNPADFFMAEMNKKYKVQIIDTLQPPTESEILQFYKELYTGVNPPALNEVKISIRKRLILERKETFPQDFVFARATGKFKIAQKDLDTLILQVPANYRELYKTPKGRNYLIRQMLQEELLYRGAKSQGFLRLPAVKIKLKDLEKDFLISKYENVFMDNNSGIPEEEMKQFYITHPQLFMENTDQKAPPALEKIKRKVIQEIILSKADLPRHYVLFAEKFTQDDTLPSFELIRQNVQKDYLELQMSLKRQNLLPLLMRQFRVKMFRQEFMDPIYLNDSLMVATAIKILADSGKLQKAEDLLLRSRNNFPESIYGDEICFALGQLYSSWEGHQNFDRAIWEYKKLLMLFPKSKHNYKAQFMIGYIYSENLRNYEKAKIAYQKVLADYPDCELSDDAQFMIKFMGKDLSQLQFLK